MVLDVPLSLSTNSPDAVTDDDEDDSGMDALQAKQNGRIPGKLHISQLLQMVLQDAQTRLFFKAQSVIQSDIKYFVPTPADLSYPEKLIGVYLG